METTENPEQLTFVYDLLLSGTRIGETTGRAYIPFTIRTTCGFVEKR